MFFDSSEPSEADVGRFIPSSQLLAWHKDMQKKFPQVYTPDDKLFGTREKQYSFGTTLKAFFDDDPNKPMKCEVVGSRWQVEFGMRQPMYVVLMDGDDMLSQIALTSAHEEGGWQALDNGIDSDEEVEEEEEEEDEEISQSQPNHGTRIENKCSYPPCYGTEANNICSKCKQVSYCDKSCQKSHWKLHKFECFDESRTKHHIETSLSCDAIQNIINDAGIDDVIEFASGTFGDGQTLEIPKNLHLCGEGMDKTVLKYNLVMKQDGCSGGQVVVRRLKVEGTVTVTDNKFDDVSFVSVEVSPGRSNGDAISIEKCKKLLLYCCEIVGGSDGVSLMDHSTNAMIDQTDISLAASRGIFANVNFKIKDSEIYNCGGYGIKGRSGWTDLGGNQLQPGPWDNLF